MTNELIFPIRKSHFVQFFLALSMLLTTSSWQVPLYIGDDGIIRHDTDINKYREHGKRPEFTCVGRYSSSENSDDYAAGVLIAPRWVLTAAHFVEDSSVWLFGDKFYHSKRIFKHPKLATLPKDRKMQWDGWDLALVELDKPVVKVVPAARYKGRLELTTVVSKIGYGYFGDGEKGMESPIYQERLGGQNTIDAIGGKVEGISLGTDVLLCDFDSPDTDEFNKIGSPTPLELEIGGSKGDSGGGIFIKRNDSWELAGIVSGAISREITYGSIMLLARVSSANSWIDSVLHQFSEQ